MAEQDPKQSQEAQPSEAQEFQPDDFEALLNGSVSIFEPQTTAREQGIRTALQILCQEALRNTAVVSEDAAETIESLIAEIDRKLSEQVNAIMHNEEFQALEGSWRGLYHLVNHTNTSEGLQLRMLTISKQDMSKMLKKFKGARWDQSPLFKKIYSSEYDVLGGTPYSCLIGDYQFDHNPQDVEMLGELSRIAAAAHAPFIAAAGPGLFGMKSWEDLSNPADLTALVQTPEYAPWHSLRDSPDAKYLGLTMPRFLARLPYDPEKNPVEGFDFREEVEGADHTKFVWANAAFAMGANITRAYELYGWCSRIRGVQSGGEVDGLPVHTFKTDDGGTDMKCPTEIAITDRREGELAKNGLIPLTHRKNKDTAAFIGAQSLHKPEEFADPDATGNAKLGAGLPYLFAVCRFAHYLKVIVRDMVGSFKEREDMERFLNDWIMQYVVDRDDASETDKAQRPLRAAEVKVEEVEGSPGYYNATFWLRPHYQLEGLTASLRLASKLPSERAE